MTIGVGDILRLTAVMGMQGQEFVNVHHLKVAANTTPNDAAYMAEFVITLAFNYADVQLNMSNTLQFLRMEGQNITKDEVLPTIAWPGLPFGSEVLPVLPTQVAPYVFWPTARLRTRAASYLPGYTENTNGAGGTLSAGALTNLQAFGDKWVPPLISANITSQKGAYNRPLNRFVVLASAVVQPMTRTQRRRRVGVGS